MTALIPLLLLALWLTLAFSLSRASSTLLRAFCAAYPEEARALILHAFSRLRHPRKLLFFVSSESRLFLERKQDTPLLAARRRLIRLFTAFLSLHVGAMLALGFLFLVLKSP